MITIQDKEAMISLLRQAGEAVCRRVHAAVTSQSADTLSAIYKEGEDDTIYQIDRDVEEILVPLLSLHAEDLGGIVVIGEGIGEDAHNPEVLPHGLAPENAKWRIIIDPIDGTRGIMYDKRSAFFLAGAAPNKGNTTRLSDIEVAVMTELPTSRSVLSDTLWAIKGQGVQAETLHLETLVRKPRTIKPSGAHTIIGGFAQLARFFPPGRDVLARIEDKLILELVPNLVPGRAIIFEDQYISTGGQLYEVLVGHDRFVGDLRSRLYPYLQTKGIVPGHVCHPYDACTFLIGQEAGCIITDCFGEAFDAPLDVLTDVGFLLFANQHIYQEVWPRLKRLISEEGF